jgi:hypothetical protein
MQEPQNCRLQEEHRADRRTVADALETVRQHLALDNVMRAHIEIGPLRLPSGERTALVDVVFPDLGCRVSLPTSARFRALSGSERKQFEIGRLEGAEVCFDGSVQLADGTKLRAIEVHATALPHNPTDLEWRIVRHTVAIIGAEERCYRSLREGVPSELQHMVPELRFLDCSKLAGLELPPLKEITSFIAERDWTLKKLSQQKVADALRRFGIRVPNLRPRRAAHTPGCTVN